MDETKPPADPEPNELEKALLEMDTPPVPEETDAVSSVGGDTAPAPKPEPAKPAEPSADDRIAAALAAIESQKQEIAALRAQIPQTSSREPKSADQPVPSIEFEEVLGRRIPKDVAKRPIRVTADDLVKFGWNEDPAATIEKLANAFFDFVLESIPAVTTQGWQQRTEAEQRRAQNIKHFSDNHPDLVQFEPFIRTVEQQSWRDGSLRLQDYDGSPGRTQAEYNLALGKKTREAIAAMRGITYDQYVATLRAPSRGAPASSRAVTTSTGGRGGRAQPDQSELQKELDDL